MSGPRRLDLRSQRPEDVELEEVARHLGNDGIVLHPTGTVYGFGSLLRSRALARLARLKVREPDHPFLVLLPDRAAASELRWTPEARELADVFWPGALTLVLSDPNRRFPREVRGREGTVAVRCTSSPLTARLLRELGEPMTSSSANVRGERPSRTGEEAWEVVCRLQAGSETWLLDVGPLPPSEVSTIVDCTGPTPRIVRSGATPANRLRCVIREIAGEAPA